MRRKETSGKGAHNVTPPCLTVTRRGNAPGMRLRERVRAAGSHWNTIAKEKNPRGTMPAESGTAWVPRLSAGRTVPFVETLSS